MRRMRRRMSLRLHLALAGKSSGLSRQGAGQRKDLRRMPAMRRGLRMGWYLHNAHRSENGIPRSAWLPHWRGSRLRRSCARHIDYREPARRSALCFLNLALAALVFFALLDGRPTRAASPAPIPPEVACTTIRDSVRKVAKAERDQAL